MSSIPSIRYLRSLFKTMRQEGVQSVTLGDVIIDMAPADSQVSEVPADFTHNPDDVEQSPEFGMGLPTTPEELEARINNLGREYE